MHPFFSAVLSNPFSLRRAGRQVRQAVDAARQQATTFLQF